MLNLHLEVIQLIFNKLDLKSKFSFLQAIVNDVRYLNIANWIKSVPISVSVNTRRDLLYNEDLISIDDFISYLQYDCTFNVKFNITLLVGEYLVYDVLKTYSNKINTFSISYLCPIVKFLIEPSWFDKLIGLRFSYNEPPSLFTSVLPKLKNLTFLEAGNISSFDTVMENISDNARVEHLNLSEIECISQLPKSLKRLEIYGSGHLDCKVDKLPDSITNLHLDIADLSYTNIKNLIRNNTLLYSLDVFGLDEIEDLIEDLIGFPNLKRLTTDSTFNLQLVNLLNLNFLELQTQYNSVDICMNLNELKIDQLFINPDIGVFKNCNLKFLSVEQVNLEKMGDIEFCELLEDLHLHRLSITNLLSSDEIDESDFEIDGSFIKLPQKLKSLVINAFSINSLENIPRSIKELTLINNKFKSIGSFQGYDNLQTLKLDGNLLKTLDIRAQNLKTLSVVLTPIKQLVVNESIENIITSYGLLESIEKITNWSKLTKLKKIEFLNPNMNVIRNIEFPASLNKIRLKFNLLENVQFHSEYLTDLQLQITNPTENIFVNVSFPHVQRLAILTGGQTKIQPNLYSFLQNMQVRDLSLNCNMDTKVDNPLFLPATIEKLSLVIPSKEVHLEFPHNCHTNVKEINISSNSLHEKYSQFSFYSLGHGKNNCFHNLLQHISSDIPPVLSSNVDATVQEIVNDKEIDWKSYEWDTNLLWEIFNHNEFPPSLILLIQIYFSADRWRIVHPKYKYIETKIHDKLK